MGERGLAIRSGQLKQGWEQSDFPVLCESCLGDNPYIRMLKEPYGKECKICTRPFTVFRWKAGTKGRYKKTEVCQTCAKMKNVCQTCLFDLEYGLPVEVRDKFLDENQVVIPTSIPNRDYFIEQANKNISNLDLPYFKEKNPVLEKLAKNQPDYRKNEPHVCSFFLKGTCKRGLECPYKHDTNEPNNSVSDQNLKNRYLGKSDPLAEKILNKYFASKMKQQLPADPNIKTLVVHSLGENVSHAEVKEIFQKFGEIESININMGKTHLKTAEITYKTRREAEEAMSNLFNKLTIQNTLYSVRWKIVSEENNPLGINYDNDDDLLVPPDFTIKTNSGINRPKPPCIPPPEIYHDNDKQQKALLNIIQQSQHTEPQMYPSMNPYATGGKRKFN